MPNPYAVVDGAPWGGWELPWDRGLDGGLPKEVNADAETERLAWWVFHLGVMLWEIQRGHCSPIDIVMCMPEARWLDWALCWLLEAPHPAPPPWYRFAERRAWKRRQLGALHLESALSGLYYGLRIQAEQDAREALHSARQRRGEAQPQVMWQ